MNLYKLNNRFNRVVAVNLIVVVLWIILMAKGVLPGYIKSGLTGSNISHDAYHSYAQYIDSEIVTDWHGVLFAYQGIFLKKICYFLGLKLTGLDCINVMAFIAITIMMLSVSYLSSIGCKKSAWYVFFPFILLAIVRINGGFSLWRQDNFFTMMLIPLIACVVALYRCHSKNVKILIACCIIILLWNCCGYRRNALILVPLIVFSIIYSSEKVKKSGFFKKITYVAIFSGVLFILFMPVQKLIMPSVRTYPEAAMMMSDVRIAHVLRNTQESFFADNPDMERYPAVDNVIGAYWHTPHTYKDCILCQSYYKKYSVYPTMSHSLNPYNLYYKSWQHMRRDMIVAKIIQIAQFYRLDNLPFFKSTIENMYPNTRGKWGVSSSKKNVLRIWGTLLMLFILTCISWRRIRLMNKADITMDHLCIFLSGIVFIYYFSFLVVTPTPDYRYIAPSMIIGQISIVIFIGRHIREIWQMYCKHI